MILPGHLHQHSYTTILELRETTHNYHHIHNQQLNLHQYIHIP